MDYAFKEHTIEAVEGMRFYLATDGFLDQNGGEKGFPFGKKRFQALLVEYARLSMAEQKKIFMQKLLEYQGDNERNDDIAVVGFEI